MATLDQRPKHKPSPKHTLDEVLKSLQDLIRNDLIDSGAARVDSTADEKSGHRRTQSPQTRSDVQGRTSPGPRGSASGPRETSARAEGNVQDRRTSETRSVAGRAARARPNVASSTVDNVLDSLRELIVQELSEAQRVPSTQAHQKSIAASGSDSAPPNAAKPTTVSARETRSQEKNPPARTESSRARRNREEQAEFPFRDVQGRTSAGTHGDAQGRASPGPRGSASGPRETSARAEDDVQGRTSAGARAEGQDTSLTNARTGNESDKPPLAAPGAAPQAADGFDYEYIDLDAPADDDLVSDPNLSAGIHNAGGGLEEIVAPPISDDVEVETKRRGAVDHRGSKGPAQKSPTLENDSAKKSAKTLEVVEWDDIPVLDEVAAHPDDDLIGHGPEVSQSASDAGIPKPDRLREIAVKVVARLNIELRKCGERGLEPRTVDRLNFLLREALKTPKSNQSGKNKS